MIYSLYFLIFIQREILYDTHHLTNNPRTTIPLPTSDIVATAAGAVHMPVSIPAVRTRSLVFPCPLAFVLQLAQLLDQSNGQVI